MIYGTYYDESDERPGFSIGGYAANYMTWVHLDWKWQSLLSRWNLKYFKASECENLLGEFAQYRRNPNDLKAPLDQSERAKQIEIKIEFIDAICKHGDDLQGYGAVVIVEDFDRIVKESEAALETFGTKPYYVCFQLCLTAAALPAADWNDRHSLDNRVNIKPIFDTHKEYSGLSKDLFNNYVRKNPRSATVLLPPDYEDDIQTRALQVADTLAYEIRKHLTRKIKMADDYMRVPMQRLQPFVYRVYLLNYETLKVIVANQKPDSIPINHVRPEELW